MPPYSTTNTVLRKWLHAILVLPDGRLLAERLSIGNQVGGRNATSKWAVTIGVQCMDRRSDVAVLGRMIDKKFGINIVADKNLEIFQLLTHTGDPRPSRFSFSDVRSVMEIYKVKSINNLTLKVNNHSEISALHCEELIEEVGREGCEFDEETIKVMNILDAMGVKL